MNLSLHIELNSQTIVNGGVTVTLGENEQFAVFDNDNFILTIENQGTGSGNADDAGYTTGAIRDFEADVNTGKLAVSFGADRQTCTITSPGGAGTGLYGIGSIKLSVAFSKNVVQRKVKTAAKMQILEVTKTNNNTDAPLFGLSYSRLLVLVLKIEKSHSVRLMCMRFMLYTNPKMTRQLKFLL